MNAGDLEPKRLCAICPRPLVRGGLFCSRQCAGKVRQRPRQRAERQRVYWINRSAQKEWQEFEPAFRAWAAIYWPEVLRA